MSEYPNVGIIAKAIEVYFSIWLLFLPKNRKRIHMIHQFTLLCSFYKKSYMAPEQRFHIWHPNGDLVSFHKVLLLKLNYGCLHEMIRINCGRWYLPSLVVEMLLFVITTVHTCVSIITPFSSNFLTKHFLFECACIELCMAASVIRTFVPLQCWS